MRSSAALMNADSILPGRLDHLLRQVAHDDSMRRVADGVRRSRVRDSSGDATPSAHDRFAGAKSLVSFELVARLERSTHAAGRQSGDGRHRPRIRDHVQRVARAHDRDGCVAVAHVGDELQVVGDVLHVLVERH